MYLQIMEQVRAKIATEDWKRDAPIPSIRGLAVELRISVITVKRAYRELEREGVIVTRQGKGSYVSGDVKLGIKLHLVELDRHLTVAAQWGQQMGTSQEELVARQEVISELMTVMEDETRTVLFSSHNTQDVEKISDFIAFIDQGRVLACADKESFLEQWRRIRLEFPEGDIPSREGDDCSSRNGRQAVITSRRFGPETIPFYEQAGATVQRVESMTLEEIFLAIVKRSETEVAT